jgi:glutamate--cysteine ligase
MAELDKLASPCGSPVYSSMDIRDAGWKVAAVDVNLFPAGFNILTPVARERAAKRMREFLSAKLLVPAPWRITVVPEAHTSNTGYLENLVGILGIMRAAGCDPRLLWPGDPLPKAWTVKTPSGDLEYLPAAEALTGAQALLLNHDLSGGIPKVIEGVALPTFPSPRLGWYRRRKSSHHEIVDALLDKLAARVPDFDAWRFRVRSTTLANVDFGRTEDLERIAAAGEGLLKTLRADYAERDIQEEPRLFVKNDAGTYGMGVLSVRSTDELLNGGRQLRNKMRKGKDSVPISQVIIQEAIPTAYACRGKSAAAPLPDAKVSAAEPVLYLVNGTAIGGFCRVHDELGADARWENLNQPGSKLVPFDFDASRPNLDPFPPARPNGARCAEGAVDPVYVFVARLHATAAGLEDCPA